MVKSTIESIEGMDTVNIEDISADKLKQIVECLNKTIENAQKERQTIISVLAKRGEKALLTDR